MEYGFDAARADETDAVMALINEAKASGNTDWDDEYPNRDIVGSDVAANAVYVLRDAAGVPVACIAIHSWDAETEFEWTVEGISWTATDAPFTLSRLCVSAALQNKGLGRRLMLDALGRVRELGATGVRFLASETNPVANALYTSMQFDMRGRGTVYDWPFIAYERLF